MKEKLILTCKDCGVVFNHEQEFIPNDFDKNIDKVKPLVAQKKVIKAKINDAKINGTIETNSELFDMLSKVDGELFKYMGNPNYEPARCPECRELVKQGRREGRSL